ncbi:MAG: sulfotransferase domain-containing protein [bacterium]
MRSLPWIINRSWGLLTARYRKLPDFIIIGVQKAGTSTLFEYLKLHPDLKVATTKEVHYYDEKYRRGKFYYKSFFPLKNNKNLTGESSPFYFFHPRVPKRIFKDNPNVRLIVLLRNPVERAFSHYQHNLRKNREPIESFSEAIKNEEIRIEEDRKLCCGNRSHSCYEYKHFSYLQRGKYSEQIEKWLHFFDINQFLFLKSEDFFEYPKSQLQRCYEFLGIRNIFPKEIKVYNAGKYSHKPSDETIKSLIPYLQEENKKLSELIGKEFRWDNIFKKDINDY